MSKKLTILVYPMDAVGHVNACIGIGEQLRDRGHKVVFVVRESWANKMTSQGFFEEYLDPPPEKTEEGSDTEDPEKKLRIWNEIAKGMAPLFVLPPEEQVQKLLPLFFYEFVNQLKKYHTRLQEIVASVKPDVILVDSVFHQPAVMDAGIPWILSFSISPSSLSTKNVPPPFAGFPTDSTREVWGNYLEAYYPIFKPIFETMKEFVFVNGRGTELKFYDSPLFLKYSPYANIYMYPEELDYTDIRPNPPNFHRFDTFIRASKETFEIPDSLKNKPGKLIYLSMGTIGCSEIGLMKNLVSILAKSKHRIIVSKGPSGDSYELAPNMWGDSYVPQIQLLPLVDLVICHAGNNTVTEALYFGKPLIVLPLFADQPDNAQRVQETGLGLRFHAVKVTEEELLGGIEKLLADDELATRLEQISKRIQSANNLERVADLVENVARNQTN